MFDYPTTETQIDIGTVGWEGDPEHWSKGTGDNDGYTLVKVQLFRGRDFTQDLKPNIGQGHKILCQISSQIYRIPPPGTRVYIAFPKGMEVAPGAGVIFATVEKNPDRLESDRAILDFGDDTHVIIRGRSVSITDVDNRFISVGVPRGAGDADAGIVFQEINGTGGMIKDSDVIFFSAGDDGDAKSVLTISVGSLELVHKVTGGTSFLQLGQDVTIGTPNNGFILPKVLLLGSTADPSKWKTVTTAGGPSTGVLAVAP